MSSIRYSFNMHMGFVFFKSYCLKHKVSINDVALLNIFSSCVIFSLSLLIQGFFFSLLLLFIGINNRMIVHYCFSVQRGKSHKPSNK